MTDKELQAIKARAEAAHSEDALALVAEVERLQRWLTWIGATVSTRDGRQLPEAVDALAGKPAPY